MIIMSDLKIAWKEIHGGAISQNLEDHLRRTEGEKEAVYMKCRIHGKAQTSSCTN